MNATTKTETQVLELAPAEHAAQPIAIHQQSAPVSDSIALIQAITNAAHNPDVDIEKMERLWAMRERLAAKDAEKAFNDSMVSAQSKMGRISADATNPQTRSRYATYAQLDRHLRPIYTAYGFSLSFNSGTDAPEGHVRVLCYVSHSTGHTRTYQCDMPSDGKGAKGNDVMTKTHAAGSAMSYGMRYLLKLIFNVAVGEDDDDGNAAGQGDAGPSEYAQEWIDYAKSHKADPDKFKAACKEARAAFNQGRDAAGLKAFNAAVGGV